MWIAVLSIESCQNAFAQGEIMMKFKCGVLLALFCSVFVPRLQAAESPDRKSFTNESEAGIVVANGNSRSQTLNFKQLNSYAWLENILKFTARFTKSSSRGVDSVYYWSLGLRYERVLTDRFSVFASQALESDLFAGYLQRYNTDVGGKQVLLKDDGWLWNLEAGYRYMKEHRFTQPDVKNHFVRLYSDVNKVWTPTFSTLLWLEYLPNLTNSSAYQVNSELSLTAVMTDVFSLKSAYLMKYNHAPSSAAAEKTDTLLTTALVAKF